MEELDFCNLLRALKVIIETQGEFCYPKERKDVISWLESRIKEPPTRPKGE